MSQKKPEPSTGSLFGKMFLIFILITVGPYLLSKAIHGPDWDPEASRPTPSPIPAEMSVSDALSFSADLVFSDDLVSCRYTPGTSIWITFHVDGTSGDAVRRTACKRALLMLENIHEIDLAKTLDFQDVNFTAVTEFVDVYGNTSTKDALSFWISHGDLARINYDNIIPSNLLEIATGVYQHPAILK